MFITSSLRSSFINAALRGSRKININTRAMPCNPPDSPGWRTACGDEATRALRRACEHAHGKEPLRLSVDRPTPASQLMGRSPATLDQPKIEVDRAKKPGAHGLRDLDLIFSLVTRYQTKILHSVTRYRIIRIR